MHVQSYCLKNFWPAKKIWPDTSFTRDRSIFFAVHKELWTAMRLNFGTVMVMLYQTIRRNTALQCWNSVATIRNNIAKMLQRRVAACEKSWSRIRVNVRIFSRSKIRPVDFLTFSLLSLSRHRKFPLECQVYDRLLLFTNPESATGPGKAVGAGRRKEQRGKNREVCWDVALRILYISGFISVTTLNMK